MCKEQSTASRAQSCTSPGGEGPKAAPTLAEATERPGGPRHLPVMGARCRELRGFFRLEVEGPSEAEAGSSVWGCKVGAGRQLAWLESHVAGGREVVGG